MAKSLHESLRELARLLGELNFQFPREGVAAGTLRDRTVRRLTDHLAARGRDLDAPLVAVLVGSTGVGKTTILNSLVGEIGPTSVQRPTTLTPVLVHHPDDELWLAADRILGGFDKIRLDADEASAEGSHSERPVLQVKTSEKLRPGIFLIDTPDVDSYVETNRHLALQLLDAADLWIFVTTAQRYAEPQGIDLLKAAARRKVAVGVVLNRVGHGSLLDSKTGFSEKIQQAGLGDTPIFAITEGQLQGGMLPDADVETLKKWLDGLAGDALLRTATARQTLFGSLAEVLETSRKLASIFAAEEEQSQRAQTALAELAASQKSAGEHYWLETPILEGEPVSRFNHYAQAILEEDSAEDSWIRKRLNWRRSLYGEKLSLRPGVEAAKRALDAAQESFMASIPRTIHPRLEDLDLEPSQGGGLGEDWKTASLYSQWHRALSGAISAKQTADRPWREETPEAIFLALLMELYVAEEQTPVTFLEHYLTSADHEELKTKLRETVAGSVETWAEEVHEAMEKLVPATEDNPAQAKEILKLITELQEQWSQ